MKTLLSILLLLFVAKCALAGDIEVGGIYYEFDEATGTASVTYKGKCQCSGDAYKGHVVVPSSVEYGGRTYAVTGIGAHAFSSSHDLTSVDVAETVESIGTSAFIGCYSLERVTFGVSSRLTSIGRHAFLACKKLEAIEIPQNVQYIGAYAFQLCEGLHSVTYVEPSALTTIDDYVFCRTGLSEVSVPRSVTAISAVAFCQNVNMKEVRLPANVRVISAQNPFAYNTQVTSIEVEEGNEVYDSREGCNAIIETASNTLTSGCKATVIPASVTAIGRSAFNHVTDLTDAALPGSIRYIGKYAYLGCGGLRSFYFPSTMLSMADSVFQRIDGLDSITCMTQRPFSIDESDFMPAVYEKATLYVPAGTAPLYRAAQVWCKFRNIVEMDRFVVGGVSYRVTGEGTAEVTKPQEGVDYEGTISIPSRVTSGTNTYTVSGAAEGALTAAAGKTLRAIWTNIPEKGHNVVAYGTRGHIRIEGAEGEAQVVNSVGVVVVKTNKRIIPIEQGVYIVCVDGVNTKVVVD